MSSSPPDASDSTANGDGSPIDESPWGHAARDDGQMPAVNYGHLAIQGSEAGSAELSPGVDDLPETRSWPLADIGAEYGGASKVKIAVPVVVDACGVSERASRDVGRLMVGAAICGATLVVGDEICQADPHEKRNAQGRITASPEMDRRIEIYRRYCRGMGEIAVRAGIEDAERGLAEYLLDKHGLTTVELAWGPRGMNSNGVGESTSDRLEQALEWKHLGHLVIPNPADPVVQAAYRNGIVERFERHELHGFMAEDAFFGQCERLRKRGFERILLRTGARALCELALVLKWSAAAGIDLVTVGGTTAAVEEGGLPDLYVHAKVMQLAQRLAAKQARVPDLAFAGEFRTGDQLFKALALGTPFVKAVCLERVCGIPDFAGHVHKLAQGLRRRMVGAGRFRLGSLRREDLLSLTRACADVTGIPYVMDADRAAAEAILDG